jgi:mRNA interferase MazF
MEVRRGDVVVVALQGDLGKPRPAVAVQSDLFNATHSTVSVCPLTTTEVDADLFLIRIPARKGNGLSTTSYVMVDKAFPARREQIGRRIGKLTPREMTSIDEALRLWLGL